jgi:predicted lipoprotein with Yx(FWY)xxD motif
MFMFSPTRTTTRVVGLVCALMIAAACSSGGGASTAPSAAPASVAPASVAPPSTEPASAAPSAEQSEAAGETYELAIVKNATLGDFLAGEGGMTLYTFTPDTTPNKSVCNGDCAVNWPPLLLEDGETATGGDGVTGTIATFARDDGATQVSYNGTPLYYFKNDKAAGDTNGQGVGEKWFVAKP